MHMYYVASDWFRAAAIVSGTVTMMRDYDICRQGDVLTPEQAKLLVRRLLITVDCFVASPWRFKPFKRQISVTLINGRFAAFKTFLSGEFRNVLHLNEYQFLNEKICIFLIYMQHMFIFSIHEIARALSRPALFNRSYGYTHRFNVDPKRVFSPIN